MRTRWKVAAAGLGDETPRYLLKNGEKKHNQEWRSFHVFVCASVSARVSSPCMRVDCAGYQGISNRAALAMM